MNRFPPRFMQPIMPEMAPPLGNVQFRPPQGNGLKLGGPGGSETTGPGHPQPQQPGGGLGMSEGIAAGGLLAKMAGGKASPLAGLNPQSGVGGPMLIDPFFQMGGTNSLDAFLGAGKGAGNIGSFMGGIAGSGGAGGSPFPAMSGALGGAGEMGGLLGSAAGGPEMLAAGSDLGLQAAGQNALGLSNPYTAAAMAVPGILNMAGLNIPNPIDFLFG